MCARIDSVLPDGVAAVFVDAMTADEALDLLTAGAGPSNGENAAKSLVIRPELFVRESS